MSEKKLKTGLDLASLDTKQASEQGAEIELRHPVTNDKLGIFISILGQDSKAFTELKRKRHDTMLRKFQAAKRRGKDTELPGYDESKEQDIETLVVCTTGWRDNDKPTITIGGEELPFTTANATIVYRDFQWIFDQINEAITDYANFMKA